MTENKFNLLKCHNNSVGNLYLQTKNILCFSYFFFRYHEAKILEKYTNFPNVLDWNWKIIMLIFIDCAPTQERPVTNPGYIYYNIT